MFPTADQRIRADAVGQPPARHAKVLRRTRNSPPALLPDLGLAASFWVVSSCVCVPVSVCVYVCACVSVSVYVYLRVSVYASVYGSVYASVYAWIEYASVMSHQHFLYIQTLDLRRRACAHRICLSPFWPPRAPAHSRNPATELSLPWRIDGEVPRAMHTQAVLGPIAFLRCPPICPWGCAVPVMCCVGSPVARAEQAPLTHWVGCTASHVTCKWRLVCRAMPGVGTRDGRIGPRAWHAKHCSYPRKSLVEALSGSLLGMP